MFWIPTWIVYNDILSGSMTTIFGKESGFGKDAHVEVHGVFVYRVNDSGMRISLRGFWDFEEAMKNLSPG